jgi:hypothetical protein
MMWNASCDDPACVQTLQRPSLEKLRTADVVHFIAIA